MKIQIVFPILFFSILNVSTVLSEPISDTKIVLTASHGESFGRVEAKNEVLQHSEFLKKMLEIEMLEGLRFRLVKDNVTNLTLKLIDQHIEPFKLAAEQVINGDEISLDVILGKIYQDLQRFGVEDFFEPQELLHEIVKILGCVNRNKDLILNQFSLNQVLQLLLVGDVLQIKELVEVATYILAENITIVEPEILLLLMEYDVCTFSAELNQKIVEKNYDLFYPVVVSEPEATLEGHTNYVFDASFSLDGTKIVTASGDHTVKVWGVDKYGAWKCVATLDTGRNVLSAKFSPDGKQIVICHYQEVDPAAIVWRVSGDGVWECVAKLKGHANYVVDASFSFDGTRIITASDDGTAKIWHEGANGDWVCGTTIEVCKDHVRENHVRYARFSPDGNRVFTFSDQYSAVVRVWSVDEMGSWMCVEIFKKYYSEHIRADVCLDGNKIFAGPLDGLASVFAEDKDGVWKNLGTLPRSSVFSASFSSDGNSAVAGYRYGPVDVFRGVDKSEEAIDGYFRPLLTLKGHTSTVFASSFSSEGEKILTASRDCTAKVWDVSLLNEPLTLSQALFFVLLEEHPEYYQNLSGDWFNFVSEAWISLTSQMRKHLCVKIRSKNLF